MTIYFIKQNSDFKKLRYRLKCIYTSPAYRCHATLTDTLSHWVSVTFYLNKERRHFVWNQVQLLLTCFLMSHSVNKTSLDCLIKSHTPSKTAHLAMLCNVLFGGPGAQRSPPKHKSCGWWQETGNNASIEKISVKQIMVLHRNANLNTDHQRCLSSSYVRPHFKTTCTHLYLADWSSWGKVQTQKPVKKIKITASAYPVHFMWRPRLGVRLKCYGGDQWSQIRQTKHTTN